MVAEFGQIPQVVVDYVRTVFASGNDAVSRAVGLHPSMYEETLDHLLVMNLSAAPAAFFAAECAAVSIESHWLGSRWMFGRWEIADIAFFVLLRRRGRLLARKVALVQTKRLYSKEIDVAVLEKADYQIGIGRLADRTDPSVPLSKQRAFSFDHDCVYGAMRAGDPQLTRIVDYMGAKTIPVYYGLYNPVSLPFAALYPPLDGTGSKQENTFGCRVIPAVDVHSALEKLSKGKAPSVSELGAERPVDSQDVLSIFGWRLERFIADEVLRCRHGRIFEDQQDPNLHALLYRRSAPIAAAIAITIDLGAPD